VGLAQALINDPPILILDEPTIGLDPKQIREVRELIKALAGSHTIVLSTHILPEVEQTCSRVLIINRGKIAADMRIQGSGADHVFLEVEGPAAAVRERLGALPRVVDAQMTGGDDGHARFQIQTEPGTDLRRDLARTVVEGGWGLIEIRASMGLEDLFIKLTTEDITQPEATEAAVSAADSDTPAETETPES
jgi:ABC-2 type transport system ATP-binding protein